jgi:magnesium-transporting ATPase (P-type)
MQKVRIYARANPEQKAQIVRSLKSFLGPKDFNVGFIGDGSNDFKAFREADVSLCIGEKEGSLAAHFSSPSESMMTIKDFLIEGRLSLQMNLDNILMNIFKGFSELFLILIVHFAGLNLCKIDFILNTLLIYPLFFSKDTRAPPKVLTSFLPRNSILHKEVILLLLSSILLGFINLISGYYFISSWDLFKQVDEIYPTEDPLFINSRFFVLNKYLVYIYFIVTMIGVTALNVGYPNTTSVFRSPLFVIILVFNVILVNLLLFADKIFPDNVLTVLTNIFRIPDYDDVMRIKIVIWSVMFALFIFIFIKLYSFTWLFSKCKTSQQNQERDHIDQKVTVFDDFKNELVEILRPE